MSYVFNGTDTRIEHANAGTIPATITILAWVKPNSFAAGRVVVHGWYNSGPGEITALELVSGSTTGRIRFEATWSGGIARWVGDDDQVSASAWQAFAITYNSGSTANDPLIYYKSAPGASLVAATVTEQATPSGTYANGSDGIWSGGVFGSYIYSGRLAYVRTFNSILNSTQINAELESGPGILGSEYLDCPFTVDASDSSGNGRNGTVTNATFDGADNPTLGGGGGGGGVVPKIVSLISGVDLMSGVR